MDLYCNSTKRRICKRKTNGKRHCIRGRLTWARTLSSALIHLLERHQLFCHSKTVGEKQLFDHQNTLVKPYARASAQYNPAHLWLIFNDLLHSSTVPHLAHLRPLTAFVQTDYRTPVKCTGLTVTDLRVSAQLKHSPRPPVCLPPPHCRTTRRLPLAEALTLPACPERFLLASIWPRFISSHNAPG